MLGRFASALFAMALVAMTSATAMADGALDGRVFSGKIGPVENPDLDDSLHFNDGYFWSDICTRCGFQPGRYTSTRTDDGIRFSGVLVSDSRGQFLELLQRFTLDVKFDELAGIDQTR